MGDRIAVLNGGELQQIGTPLECYHEPANKFVAGFIGSPSMNFVNVTYRNGRLEAPSFSYSIPSEIEETIQDASQELSLGIRPQDIELADPSVENAIPASVNVVEPMGEVSYLYLEIADQTFTASVSGELIINEDQDLHVVFPSDRIHLFEQSTGDAVKNRKSIDEGEALEKHMIAPTDE